MSDTLRAAIVDLSSDHVWSMGNALKAQPGVELIALSDVNEPLRAKGMETFGIPVAYADHVQMLDEVKPDVILVCGDNAMKPGMVEEAARRGIHVYLDKPMAANLVGADRLIAAARAGGIVAMTAYHTAFSQGYREIKQWIDEGRIGQVFLAKMSIGHAGPIEIGLSTYFSDWLLDASRNGGGSFIDEACYAISTFTDYFGPVAEISCYTTQQGWREYLAPDVEDNAVAILRFKCGILGVIDAKWGQIGNIPFARSIHGNEGTIQIGRGDCQVYSRVQHAGDKPEWETITWPQAPRNYEEAAYFVACVREGKQPEGASSLEGARHTQEVIEAAYRSAREGRSIQLPL